MLSHMFVGLVALVAVVSPVNAAYIKIRKTAPSTYNSDILEDYQTYHTRYLALDCQDQHNTQFFTDCCHPLLKTQSLSDRPAQCTPSDDSNCPDDGNNGGDNGDNTPANPAQSPDPSPAESNPDPTPAPPPPAPSPPPPPAPADPSGGHQLNEGGVATFFFQGGNPGACGTVHQDSDFVAAMDQARYGDSGNASPLCGQQVHIKNLNNGKTVTVTVADDCPTCNNGNSIDLSVAAFTAIATEEEGEVPIEWFFVN